VLRRKASTRVAVAALLAAVLVATLGSAANAATGYSTYSGSTWNVRSCPATCTVVATISGSIPNLVCQSSGPAVTVSGFGTSTIYDMVRTSSGVLGYMSDLGVAQTPYGVFSPNLPRCTAAPGPATQTATNSGYSWIITCSFQVWAGKTWACWQAGLKQLFIPDPAY
jgi:hypothetical protein